MSTFISIASYVFVFQLGRIVANNFREQYLEDKKQELIEYHAQLLAIADSLEKKDAAIRAKWQTMVDDISKYQYAIDPSDAGKWTEMDDIYLQSWGSAEK